MTASELAVLLESAGLRCGTELSLQDGIERTLQSAGIEFTREHRLSAKDRPDFLVGGIAVEAKIHGSANEVARQLARYAAHDCVEEILLVTSRVQLARIPESLGRKPVRVAAILGGF